MSSEPPPPGSGQPPDEDPFKKQPPPAEGGGSPYDGSSPPTPPQGSPYDSPYGDQPPPHGGGDPYGPGGPYGGDPLAGMPPLADSGKRTVARIIDMILVGIVVWLLSWAFGVMQYNMNADKIEYSRGFGQSVIAAVLYVGYDTIMISRSGRPSARSCST